MKAQAQKLRFSLSRVLIAAVLLVAGGITYGLVVPSVLSEGSSSDLPLVGTYDNLLELLEKSRNQGNLYIENDVAKSMVSTAEAAAGDSSSSSNFDYSATNVQVQGVDEADLVKTDGSFIYQVNKDRVLIIKAQPANQMELAATIKFDDSQFEPVDLYLDSNTLIVTGTCNRDNYSPYPADVKFKTQIYPPVRSFQSTRSIIYNISNKANIVKVRELEMEGDYLSSRKVGSSFYLLTNKYLNYYYIQNRQDVTPMWRDSVQSDSLVAEKIENIRYFPDCISPNYLLVGALDINSPQTPASIQTYLGSGDQVYASQNNLYVAIQKYNYPVVSPGLSYNPVQALDYSTSIYKFALQPGRVQYCATGTVPGHILNQFSMDENKGYFRIATTSGEIWRNDQYTSSNNVYVLNPDLQICGKLENIAPGEKIYSTRFMGNRAYMVTFKNVDPFFVLDLQNPAHPAVLGKLKIPGYSDYLHPYDETHIIGFGKDTVETKVGTGQSQAYYQGMKIALFDVTNVNNPVEMSRALIGDRGTDSELLNNHKALLFSAGKNLLAFPVTVMEVNDQNRSSATDYGSFSFQGLYVYHIDLSNGLQYQGRISHLSDDDYLRAGDVWYDTGKNVERALYIGDTIYTLSPAMIKANNLADLAEIKTVVFPR